MKTFPEVESYVTDTHALIWHLSQDQRLSTEARRRFERSDRGEAQIYLSVISLIEMLYLHEKNKIPPSLWRLFNEMLQTNTENSYCVMEVTRELSNVLPEVPFQVIPDMPDRIIAATAYHLRLPLITRDHRLHRWEGIVTIW